MRAARSLRDARHVDKTFYIGIDDLFYEAVGVHYRPSSEFSSIVNMMLEAHGSASSRRSSVTKKLGSWRR
jgi:hypothetical protein